MSLKAGQRGKSEGASVTRLVQAFPGMLGFRADSLCPKRHHPTSTPHLLGVCHGCNTSAKQFLPNKRVRQERDPVRGTRAPHLPPPPPRRSAVFCRVRQLHCLVLSLCFCFFLSCSFSVYLMGWKSVFFLTRCLLPPAGRSYSLHIKLQTITAKKNDRHRPCPEATELMAANTDASKLLWQLGLEEKPTNDSVA